MKIFIDCIYLIFCILLFIVISIVFFLGVTLTGRAFRLNRKGCCFNFLTKKAASVGRLFLC